MESTRKRLAYIELQLPLELLQRINLIDSPGFNSGYKHHTEAVRTFLSRADAAFWLFNYRTVGTASELSQVEELYRQGIRTYGSSTKSTCTTTSKGRSRRFLITT